jgi:two-component system chemotaxis sensor kinase CheA
VDSVGQAPTAKRERLFQTDTVRISVDKLDPLLRQVEEMVSVKLTTNQRVADLNAVMSTIGQWKQKWTNVASHDKTIGKALLRKSDAAAPNLTETQFSKLMDFLNWNETFVKTLEDRLKTLARSADGDARMQGQMVDDLLEDMMNVLMLPCSSLVEVFPKLVRDLSRDAGKDVYLEIRGGDLEIDRRILEEMKDPLIHLVRNAIDHGIESPEERRGNAKPERGTLTIAFSQISGNQVELMVADDGAGIDGARVREAAARKGVLTEQEKLQIEPQDALSLVFRSEVSTSSKVTSISGRGLGLAIVREKVENLGGSVSVATAPRMGTSFRILLPVTLSTFRGILIQAYAEPFIVPTANVERVARIKRDSVKTVGNRDTIEVDGRPIPLVRLGDTLELPRLDPKDADSEYIPVLILRSGERLVSFSVDGILQEQEVLVKALGRQLSRIRNVAGATVLGSGRLVPILNVSDLVKAATNRAFSRTGPALPVEELRSTAKNVLVVEDSITSRMLLKNILESSGYHVSTSVDGADAWTALKSNHFDLVVSDIEMPRMDGFELTANIRADEQLAELPVVLVTSLGSREDRERGIDVGANAYIVKGSFDQNNLLDTVERLV